MTEATFNIDWNKAPEGATHYNLQYQNWYKDNGSEYLASVWDRTKWVLSIWGSAELLRSVLFVPRPVSANQEISTKAIISTEVETASFNEAKPPLGLTPKSIWEERMQYQRRQDIHAAMQRYIEAGKDIPNDWLEELIGVNNVLAKIETDFAEAIQSLPVAEKGGWIDWGKNEKPCISADAILELEYMDGDLLKGSVEDWTWNEDNDKIENHTVARYRVLYSGEE